MYDCIFDIANAKEKSQKEFQRRKYDLVGPL